MASQSIETINQRRLVLLELDERQETSKAYVLTPQPCGFSLDLIRAEDEPEKVE